MKILFSFVVTGVVSISAVYAIATESDISRCLLLILFFYIKLKLILSDVNQYDYFQSQTDTNDDEQREELLHKTPITIAHNIVVKNFNSSTTNNNLKTTSNLSTDCSSDTAIIDKLLNGTGYNKYRLPVLTGVDVSVEFWIQDITSINEITSDFEMDIYINEMWLDPALNFERFPSCKENLSLKHEVLDRLWTPNSCFINSKVAEIHESPFKSIFLMLYKNGTVWTNYRVRVKGPCSMDLTNFPMDVQSCNLIYESFNYNNQEVRMRWNPLIKEAVYPTGRIVLPDFNLVGVATSLKNEPYPAGMWDELHVTFTFERRCVWYFMQGYVPTYFTIFISWISFSLGPHALPARTMLGVNALLAMIFQFGNVMRSLPRVSYIKAIDVWMLVSITFIFCSLLELALVGYKVKQSESKKLPIKCCKKEEMNSPILDHQGDSPPSYSRRFMFPVNAIELKWQKASWKSQSWTPDKIDRISSIAFPACFAIFNIIYWAYYTHLPE